MENYQASGEDIERALMDLGPLLGVSIKEETPDELPDAPATTNNVGVTPEVSKASVSESASPEEGAGAGGGGSTGTGAAGPGDGADGGGDGADGGAEGEEARCVICTHSLLLLEGTPKLMECLHSVCEPCLRAKIEERHNSGRDFLGAERVSITCPACRLQCQPANMIDQRFVLEKIAQDQQNNANGSTVSGPQLCNSCEDTEPATSYCVECTEFICDNCVRAHQRLKITKDHTIKSKEEAVLELQAAQNNMRDSNEMFCSEHTQERLSLFCETCDRLTCRDCQLQRHRDHKYQFSTEMAAQARMNISMLVSEVSYKRVLLGSAMKVIRERQALIADKKRALVREITNTVVKLTNAINTRGKELVLRLNEVCDAKLSTLADKRNALEQLAAITDHCLQFVHTALQQGSDTAVLYSKRAVCAQLQRIKARRADIPNPEIPVRITLQLDKLPELIKVLSTIGNIVVDGKVDGQGGGAGAGAPGGGAGQPTTPHSAVVALQHVAMQQSYVQCRSGGASPVGSSFSPALSMRAPLAPHAPHAPHNAHNALTPLRHPHVTSTTHPHHTHGMNEVNLRGLLNPASMQRRPSAMNQPSHHHYHPMMNAYSSAYAAQAQAQVQAAQAAQAQAQAAQAQAQVAQALAQRRSAPSPARSPAPHPATAKWHIPQHGYITHNSGYDPQATMSSGHDYKITLGRPPAAALAAPNTPATPAVTSTNPKTPSPALSGGLELDAVCAQSVQELMATIAKLDSNGVQVLPDSAPSPRPLPPPGPTLGAPPAPAALRARPHSGEVHSSTDGDDMHSKSLAEAALSAAATAGGAGAGASGGGSDPNEDWCAVCMDGGELMCCDKCPKVFHQYCHIPTIDKLPNETETWQCLLCVNFAELPPSPPSAEGGGGLGGGVTPREQKIMERITLELYCQYETSLPFREPVPADNVDYYSKIRSPMCLDVVRRRLQPGAGEAQYARVTDFLADCRLLFNNATTYNPPDSQIYNDAKRLEEFFEAQLVKWLPQYACWQDLAGAGAGAGAELQPGLELGHLHKRTRLE